MTNSESSRSVELNDYIGQGFRVKGAEGNPKYSLGLLATPWESEYPTANGIRVEIFEEEGILKFKLCGYERFGNSRTYNTVKRVSIRPYVEVNLKLFEKGGVFSEIGEDEDMGYVEVPTGDAVFDIRTNASGTEQEYITFVDCGLTIVMTPELDHEVTCG